MTRQLSFRCTQLKHLQSPVVLHCWRLSTIFVFFSSISFSISPLLQFQFSFPGTVWNLYFASSLNISHKIHSFYFTWRCSGFISVFLPLRLLLLFLLFSQLVFSVITKRQDQERTYERIHLFPCECIFSIEFIGLDPQGCFSFPPAWCKIILRGTLSGFNQRIWFLKRILTTTFGSFNTIIEHESETTTNRGN